MVFDPSARALPLTVKVAVDPETVADPSDVLPTLNATVPAGGVLPVAAFIVAVKTVLAVEEKLVGLAVTVVVVATGGGVTVTVTVPFEFWKLPVATKLAVMLLLPTTRLLALTVRLAVPAPTVAVPSVVFPSANVTLPVALAGLRVAFTTVLAVEAIVDGLAATVVDVAAGAAVTATVTEPFEVRKPLAGV